MTDHTPEFSPQSSPAEGTFTVLVVADQDERRLQVERIIEDAGLIARTCTSTAAAAILATGGADAAVLCADSTDPVLLDDSRRLRPDTPMMMIGESEDVALVMDYIRRGACDFVQADAAENDLVARLRAAIDCGAQDRLRSRRLERLRGICRRLSKSKQEISERLDEARNDLKVCRTGVDRQLDEASCASEFRALISQELGVEDVLRTGLEYVLTRTQPTNVAAFLANSETDFSLGAYVNYDCPREKANPVLDKLAATVCQHVAEEDELVRFDDVEQFIEAVGDDAEILRGHEVVAIPCTSEGECMAVLFLFRNAEQPFDDELASTLDGLRGILGDQLATVVRVHHRMTAEWPQDSTQDSDENTDWGFGEAA